MCEINPKRAAYFRLEAFTAAEMTEAEFYEEILAAEVRMNSTGKLRFHIHELEEDNG